MTQEFVGSVLIAVLIVGIFYTIIDYKLKGRWWWKR